MAAGRDPEHASAPPGVAPDTALVGRERERAVLRAALNAALAGRGGLVLIGGEAGIGKTTLAEALCREAAAQGAVVLVGRCYDRTETRPYGPWAEALGGATPVAEGPAPPDLAGGGAATSQQALFAAARRYLAALAADRPLVLLLDDLHWADPASLDLFRFLARHLAPLPLLILATYRSDELTRHDPFYALLPALVREARAARLELRPLDDDAVRALVAGRHPLPPGDAARLVGHLQAHAEGNALYLGELLRALAEDGLLRPCGAGWTLGDLAHRRVPPLLRQVIDGRLARLGEAARDLLAVAAVIGQEVPLDLWAALGGLDDEGLLALVERAVEARVLDLPAGGTGARFAHALVREALYEGVPPPRRRRWHRRIGEALAARPQPDPDAVAFHFQHAGDARAATWLLRAGERAERAYAWLTAIERFAAALALVEDADTGAAGGDTGAEDAGWLLLRLARLQRYVDPAGSLAYLDRAVRVATARGDAFLAVQTRFGQAYLRCFAGDFRGGMAAMEDVFAAPEAVPQLEPTRLRHLQHLGLVKDGEQRRYTLTLWSAALGRYARACALAAQDTEQATEQGHATASAKSDPRAALAFVHAGRGHPEAARHAFAQIQAEDRARGDHRQIGFALLHEFISVALPYDADRPDVLRRLVADLEAAWAQAGGVMIEPQRSLAQLPRLLLEGRWDEARDLPLTGRIAPHGVATLAATLLGPLARRQGDAARAWSLVWDVLPIGLAAEPGEAWFLPAVALQCLAAGLALDAGDLPTARAWLVAHDRWLAWADASLGVAEGRLGWAAYHRATGDPTTARAQALRALQQAAAPRQPLVLLAARRLLGELDTAAGRAADAITHLAEALALADACAAPYERALTLLALAESRAATGAVVEARAHLVEAATLCTRLGAHPARARVDALAAGLAARRTATGGIPKQAYPAGLTAREVEVLRLVASGLTDGEVAARLFLSPRTIGSHLATIYGKLGVASRMAAARFASEHGLG